MSEDIKKKTSKGWMSKLRKCKENMSPEEKEFWGPIAITLCFIAWTNVNWITISYSVSYLDIMCFLFSLLFAVFGVYIIPKKQKPFSRILIPSSFVTLFFGIRLGFSNLCVGWEIKVIALIMFVLGSYLYYRSHNVASRNKEQKQGES